MKGWWLLPTSDIFRLSYGARSTYYVSLYFAEKRNRMFDADVKIFDVVPSSTFYRHRKEIFDSTGLDLKDMFPLSKPKP